MMGAPERMGKALAVAASTHSIFNEDWTYPYDWPKSKPKATYPANVLSGDVCAELVFVSAWAMQEVTASRRIRKTTKLRSGLGHLGIDRKENIGRSTNRIRG
jgi:hypothetical protein